MRRFSENVAVVLVDNVKDQEAFVSRLGGIVKETKTAI
jgi:hypothetical protein